MTDLTDPTQWPAWAKYYAVDADYNAHWFENLPRLGQRGWLRQDGKVMWVHTDHRAKVAYGGWKTLLIERPQETAQ